WVVSSRGPGIPPGRDGHARRRWIRERGEMESDGARRGGRGRSKVTVVGAGMVGGTVAQLLAQGDYADVVLVDIVEGLPQGKALDLMEAGPVLGYDSSVIGSNGYEESAGSDVVVITSGIARKPGMSR